MSPAIKSVVSCYINNSLHKYCPAGLWNISVQWFRWSNRFVEFRPNYMALISLATCMLWYHDWFKIVGPRPDLDPDIVAALDDALDLDDSDNILDDDFIFKVLD